MIIEYIFHLADGGQYKFNVDIERKYNPATVDKSATPDWAELAYHQCPNCPLNSKEHSHCPAALDIAEASTRFSNIVSYAEVSIEVKKPHRTYSVKTDSQTALNSLLGLLMATSGCPVLSQFKGLAKTHLPAATFEETLFRTVGAYLTRQYFVHKEGKEPDLDLKGLKKIYEEVGKVNSALKNRVYAASAADSNITAVNAFFSLSTLVTMSLEDQLDELYDFLNLADIPK